ncbi:MAG: DUF5667 domain-containing protein [Anaerolineales bacterium]
MTTLFDALQNCLQEIENGADVNAVLSNYPEHAAALRPLLKTAVKAQQSQTASPSPEAIRRGRAKVLQRAAELRESKTAPQRRAISIFSRLAISFALALVFLLSGTGLLSASASALPGDRLYSVKRGWENIRLSFIFDQEARDLLKNEFETERLHEVNKLLSQGRSETIQFTGIFLQANDMNYVSGVPVVVPANTSLPSNGEAVIVTGQTNPNGLVEVFNLELLPAGTIVPIGNPIQIQIEIQPPLPAPQTDIVYFEIQGILQSVSASSINVNGQTLYIDAAQVTGQLCIGLDIKAKGYYTADNRFIAIEVFGKDACPIPSPSLPPQSGKNSNSNGDDNSGNGNSDNNDDDDDDDDDDNDND